LNSDDFQEVGHDILRIEKFCEISFVLRCGQPIMVPEWNFLIAKEHTASVKRRNFHLLFFTR